MGRSPWEN